MCDRLYISATDCGIVACLITAWYALELHWNLHTVRIQLCLVYDSHPMPVRGVVPDQ